MQKPEQPKCDSCGAYLPLSDARIVKCEYCGVKAKLRSTTPSPPDLIEEPRKFSAALLVAISAFVFLAALATIIAVAAESSTAEPNSTSVPNPSGAHRASPSSTRVEMLPLVIQVRGSNGPHYVKASTAFELSSAEAVRLYNSRSDLVRDAVEMIISEQTFERLSDPSAKTRLLEEFKKSLDMTLGKGMVKNAKFTEFALQ